MIKAEGRPGKHVERLNIFSVCSLFILSSTVISLQLVLIRSLSITRYHHFSYMVIGTALLGFGVSGTFLTLISEHLKKYYANWSAFFIFMFTVSISACYYTAEYLPIDIQYIFYEGRQIFYMTVYNFLIFVPFFCGAVVIGSALVYFKEKAPTVYGVNLLGSGAGGVYAVALMFYFPASALPATVSMIALSALFLWTFSSRVFFTGRVTVITVGLLVAGALLPGLILYYKPGIDIDQYKMISHLQRLEKQSDAKRVAHAFGPRGQVDVYDSAKLHHTMFAGIGADSPPPPQLAVLIDGQYAGTIFKIDSEKEASILDFTPQSLPYRFVDAPRVLLLGEIGGTNVWLSRRFGASKITVVQGNPQLIGLLTEAVADISGNVYKGREIEIINMEPHLFIDRTKETFDIIHIVTAEGMSAGTGGLQSLHEDYLLTVESIAGCYKRLTDRGLIAVTRGIQAPPRDNIKLFALFASALEYAGVKDGEGHVLQARNYLAANTMISKRPIDMNFIERYKDFALALFMDVEYYPGINGEDIDRINVIGGPGDGKYSYYRFGAMKIFSPEREIFLNEWVYSVSPPVDDRPYFYDFFKWSSLGRFFESYGALWIQKLELGYVVLVFIFLEVTVAALLFILIPLFLSGSSVKGKKGKSPTAIYFLCLGFGFMFIEMVFIQRFTRFMGDPVYSVSAALVSVLVFAGLGSLYQQRKEVHIIGRIVVAVFCISSVLILYLFFLDSILALFISYHISIRFIITACLLSPLSFFMGWMFPLGLRILGKKAPYFVPWAWGVNGFASVSATPLSVMLSMSYGFSGVLLIGASLYIIAGCAAIRLTYYG